MIYLENYTLQKNAKEPNAYIPPVNEILLSSDGENLTGLWFRHPHDDLKILKDKTGTYTHVPVFDATRNWLDIYFAGQIPDFMPPIAFTEGSTFRHMIWQLLLEIPYGEVTTYGALAKRMAAKLGKEKMAAQAVGGAIGSNPISIIVPCHRVVGTNGSLTGYGGGLKVKEYLLTLEHLDMTHFSMPKKSRFLDMS